MRDRVMALARLATNQLLKSRDPALGSDIQEAKEFLHAHRHFCNHVTNSWVQRGGNQGPFVLMHGDMSLHGGNLLWDKDLNLRGVIDWEWSYTVPRQCFIPPVWLIGIWPQPIRSLSLFHRGYEGEVLSLFKYIAARWPHSPLPRECKSLCLKMSYLVVLGLLYPGSISDVYWNSLDVTLHMRPISLETLRNYERGRPNRVEEFCRTAEVSTVLKRKLSEIERADSEYQRYLEENGAETGCRCESYREGKERFDNLRELPFFRTVGDEL